MRINFLAWRYGRGNFNIYILALNAPDRAIVHQVCFTS